MGEAGLTSTIERIEGELQRERVPFHIVSALETLGQQLDKAKVLEVMLRVKLDTENAAVRAAAARCLQCASQVPLPLLVEGARHLLARGSCSDLPLVAALCAADRRVRASLAPVTLPRPRTLSERCCVLAALPHICDTRISIVRESLSHRAVVLHLSALECLRVQLPEGTTDLRDLCIRFLSDDSCAVASAAAKLVASLSRSLDPLLQLYANPAASLLLRCRIAMAIAFALPPLAAKAHSYSRISHSLVTLIPHSESPVRVLVARKHLHYLLVTVLAPLFSTPDVLNAFIGLLATANTRPALATALLECIASVVSPAALPIQESLLATVLAALASPSPTVRTAASVCLLRVVVALPSLFPRARIHRGTLTTLVALAKDEPLLCSQSILDSAMALCRNPQEKEDDVLLPALLSHGPRFSRPHIPFLIHYWSSSASLDSLLSFLTHNAALVTPSLALRLQSILAGKPQTHPRVLQCHARLAALSRLSHSETLTQAIALFASISSALTSTVNNYTVTAQGQMVARHWLADTLESPLELLAHTKTISAPEYDSLAALGIIDESAAVPVQIAAVDAAIDIFAHLFPRETDAVQHGILQQLAASVTAQRDPAAQLVILLNICVALLRACKTQPVRSSRAAESALDLLLPALEHSDSTLRFVAAQTTGCLGAAHSSLVQLILKRIVDNQAPESRAGCALALGYIAAGSPVKKDWFSVLASLCSDPHPTVHFWALEGLALAIPSLGVSGIPGTLALLARIYTSKAHNPETSEVNLSNVAVTLPLCESIARCLNISVQLLGPEIEGCRARRVVHTLLSQLKQLNNDGVRVQVIHTLLLLLLFSPGVVDQAEYSSLLRNSLGGSSQVEFAALSALQQLINQGQQEIVWDLWAVLEKAHHRSRVEEIINSSLHQTAHTQPLQWIRQCQQVLFTPDESAQEQHPDLDEETAALAVAESRNEKKYSWQTRVFALQCLDSLLVIVSQKVPHVTETLIPRVGELVRAAFNAATGSVPNLRLSGLVLLEEIIENFKNIRDPDFEDMFLLEQYQAQIGSALTPAFSSDSTPDLASRALLVCGDFVASGVIRDVSKLSRFVKFLQAALKGEILGEMKSFGETADTMLTLAIVSAWAKLQIASCTMSYLTDILQPHLSELSQLWLQSLTDYANLRFGPDSYSNNALLHIYSQSWHLLVEAIASLVDHAPSIAANVFSHRSIFYVLFGLTHESLLTATNQVSASDDTLRSLHVYEQVLRPSICGFEIYKDEIFSETTDLLYRLVATQRLDLQKIVLKVAKNLAVDHPDPSIDQIFELVRLTTIVVCDSLGITQRSSHAVEISSTSPESLGLDGLDALVDIISVFPPLIKVDLYNIVFYILLHLLEADIHPIISSLCTQIVTTTIIDPSTRQPLQKVVRSFLSHITSYYQTDTCGIRTRNALTVSAIMFAAIGDTLFVSEDISSFVSTISCGYSSSELQNVSLLCTKSLLRAANSLALEIRNKLLPHLFATLSLYPFTPAMLDLAGSILLLLNPTPEKAPTAYAVMLPSLISQSHKSEVTSILVSLATKNPIAFKVAFSSLDPLQQSQITELTSAKSNRAHTQPTISLKQRFDV